MSGRSKLFIGAGLVIVCAAIILLIAAPRPIPSHILNPPKIVFVSGRDDHGLLADPLVPLYRAPASTVSTASVPDATFVRVTEEAGEWLHVQAIITPALDGWINDFYLRNLALRTDVGEQVEFVDARLDNTRLLIQVRSITQPAAPPVWLEATLLREIGARDN